MMILCKLKLFRSAKLGKKPKPLNLHKIKEMDDIEPNLKLDDDIKSLHWMIELKFSKFLSFLMILIKK